MKNAQNEKGKINAMYSADNTQILAWQAKLKWLFIPQETGKWPKTLPFSTELQMYQVVEKEYQSAINSDSSGREGLACELKTRKELILSFYLSAHVPIPLVAICWSLCSSFTLEKYKRKGRRGKKSVKRKKTCGTSNRCILPLKNMNREEFG